MRRWKFVSITIEKNKSETISLSNLICTNPF